MSLNTNVNHTATVVRSPSYPEASSVTHAVVEAVADAEGIPTSNVSPPLASVIDPDALETIVTSLDDRSGDTGEISRLRTAITGSPSTATGRSRFRNAAPGTDTDYFRLFSDSADPGVGAYR